MRSTTPGALRLLMLAVAALFAMIAARPALAQETVHVVAGGENLSTIAQGYGYSMIELAAYNGIANPNIVYVGQKIAIPSSGAVPQTLPRATAELPGAEGYHTVAGGETLSQIAKNNGCLLYTSDAADE